MLIKKYLKNISLIYGFSFVFMLTLSFLVYQKWKEFSMESNYVEHTFRVLQEIYDIDKNLYAAESMQRGFLLTEDSSMLQSYDSVVGIIRPSLQELKELTMDNPMQQDRIISMYGALIVRIRHLEWLKNEYKNHNAVGKKKLLLEEKDIMETFHTKMKEVEEVERELLKKRVDQRKIYQSITPRVFAALLIAILVLSSGSLFLIVREIMWRSRYQKELELKVLEQDRNNKELEQINFAASHNLQEPLRKIMLFSDRLISTQKELLTDDGKKLLDRIAASANDMRSLVEDLAAFTNLARTEEIASEADLNKIWKKTIESFQKSLQEHNSVIEAGTLPVINGYPIQLGLLFKEIVDNAIKFSAKNRPLHIVVTTDKVSETAHKKNLPDNDHEYIRITISDNGIGFENEFAERIFLIFQQLNTHDPSNPGKGLGLAIVRRVMINHEGYVKASGTPGKGAVFQLYFPLNQ